MSENQLISRFARLRREGKTGLMPFLTGGYPSLDLLVPLLEAIERAGASAVEIGFPFSDPIADGPVIAASMYEALSQGVTPKGVFNEVGRFARSNPDHMPLIAMTSFSIIDRMGVDRFVSQATEHGFSGLIVPDLDVGQCDDLVTAVDRADLALALLVAPNSTDKRIRDVVGNCRGFIYALARTGITGETEEQPEVAGLIRRIRAVTPLPIAVGFGISTAEHVRAATTSPPAGGGADAAIVGSALIRRLAPRESPSEAPPGTPMGGTTEHDPVSAAESFIAELVSGLAERRRRAEVQGGSVGDGGMDG